MRGYHDPNKIRCGCFLPDLTGFTSHLPTEPLPTETNHIEFLIQEKNYLASRLKETDTHKKETSIKETGYLTRLQPLISDGFASELNLFFDKGF